MKLTPEQIAKIESVLTMREDGFGARSIIIEHDISTIQDLSNFFSVMRCFGVNIPKKSLSGLHPAERAAFLDWLRERKRQSQASSNGAA